MEQEKNNIKHVLKRSLLLGLAFCLIASSFPGLRLTAKAAGTPAYSVSTIDQLKTAIASASSGDIIDVTSDITVNKAKVIAFENKSITIKSSNGSKLIRGSDFDKSTSSPNITTSASNIMIRIGNNATLTLQDIVLEGNGTTGQTNQALIWTGKDITNPSVAAANSVLILNSGAILQNAYNINTNPAGLAAGAVYSEGVITINEGAKICGCKAKYGGAMTIKGDFTMNGGEVSGNTATHSGSGDGGAAISLWNGAGKNVNFIMNGGAIKNNSAANCSAGAVYLYYDAATTLTFTMNGGAITGNYAYYNGGGVVVDASSAGAVLNINGNATINNNTAGASHTNNNIYLNSSINTFNVKGSLSGVLGVISGSPSNGLVVGQQSGYTLTASDVSAFIYDTSGYYIKPFSTGDTQIKLSNGSSVPTINTLSIPDGTANTAYSTRILANGNPSATFSISAGTLPNGLSINAATGAISGTPTVAGSYTFTVTATNTQGSAAKQYTMSISSKQATPNASVDYATGKLTGLTPNASYKITADGTTATVTANADGTIDTTGYYGKTISIVSPGDGSTTTDSEVQTIAVAAKPATPLESVFGVTNPSSAGDTTSKISGITSAYEYSTDGGNTWTTGSGSDVSVTAGDSVLIRVKATANTPASDPKTVTTTAPSRTAGSISITGDPSKTYDGSTVTDPAVTKNGTGTVTYTYYSDNAGAIGTALAGAPSDAGTYWVKAVMAEDANYTSAEDSEKFTISRVTGSISITGDPSKTYDGSTVTDPAVTKNGTGTVTYTYYIDNAGAIGSALAGAPSNAGTYWVKAAMAEDANYTAAEDSKKFTISRVAGSISITGDPSKTYDGSAVTDPAVTKNGTGAVTYTYYSDNAGAIGTAIAGAPSAVGIYWVKAGMAEDTNYTAAEDSKQFSITAASISGITVTPYTDAYDGSAHDAVAVLGTLTGDTITYSTDGTTFQAACPKYTDAGSYSVYIKIARTGCADWVSGEKTAVISRATGSVTITGDPSKTYDGSAATDPAVSKNGTGTVTYTYYRDNAGAIGTALAGAPSAVGTYWVKAAVAQDKNYTAAEATKQFSIQNDNIYGITVTSHAGTFDGKAHHAVTVTGLKAGDTVTYSTDGINYTDTCPQYTNAGSYAVYVKVARTGCADWVSGEKTVIISRAAGTVMITGNPSKTYDGKDVADPAVSKNGTGTVTYTYYKDNSGVMGTVLPGAPSAAGTYWVKAVMAQDSNYTKAEATRKFSITSIIWYKVSYHANAATGGSLPSDSHSYAKDSTVTILGNAGNLTKKGYTFVGWNTSADGKGVLYKAGDTFDIYCDTTLYAVWQINSYKVSFEDWDGSLIKEETVRYGNAASAPDDPQRTGYTFSGWNRSYSVISDDITVTAQYKINTFTVRFNANGGNNVPDQTVDYLGSATQPAEPKMSGYTFAGWFLDSAFKTPYKFDTQVKGNITLYAKWTENTAFIQQVAEGLTIESSFKFAEGDIWECVTSNFIILNSKMPGVQIDWSSSDESAVHIENGGEKATGVVNRPKDRDVSVVITATISKDNKTAKKTFLLIIKRKDASKNETRIPTERTASVQAGQNTEGETIYRTVLKDGTNIDTVIVTTEKLKKLIEKGDGSGTVSVNVGKYDQDPADEFAFEVSTDVVAALTEKGLGITLNSPEGSVTISKETLKQANKYGMELYFRIVPVADEKDEVKNNINHDGTIISMMNAGTKTVIGVPHIIETNMEGYLTTVQLPLQDIDKSKLADPKFLSSLCIYAEHGDGTTELITGKIVYNGDIPCAIEFKISNFSRFQVVSVEPASPWVTIGLCIGGVVILILLIVITIYLIKKNKSKQGKQVY